MKKALFIFGGVLCFVLSTAYGQRKCGIEDLKAAMIAKDPSWADKFEQQRASLQGIADNYLQAHSSSAAKTTDVSAIPVIFHIMVDADQLAQMGGYAGIAIRCDSQIAVLNRDYNRQNADSVNIPSGWKSRYGNVGIHFALAHTQPIGWGTPGYEVLLLPTPALTTPLTPAGFYVDAYGDYSSAKSTSSGGLDAWDVTKYLNVWCFCYADATGNLGLSYPKSYTTPTTLNDEGVTITYLALGTTSNAIDLIFPPAGQYNEGRTLTHEIGHFFEIWHTWGDDGGGCPWGSGADDGIADTPPESNHKYGIPTDTIPGGTVYDACKDSSGVLMQPIGVSTLDYMNYTDDPAMCLFTVQQAAVMASMVAPGGESYSLTQNPSLLLWPADAGVTPVGMNENLNISPNPSSGAINVSFTSTTDQLKQLTVANLLGQQVYSRQITGTPQDVYSIDLSAMSKGIYFVKCNFASGNNITRKILLQ